MAAPSVMPALRGTPESMPRLEKTGARVHGNDRQELSPPGMAACLPGDPVGRLTENPEAPFWGTHSRLELIRKAVETVPTTS